MAVKVTGGSLAWDAVLDDEYFKRQLKDLENRIAGVHTTSIEGNNRMQQSFARAAAAAGAFFSVQAGSNFLQSIVKTRGEFQQLEVAFRTMLGSKEKADQLMAQAVKLAATTPFSLDQVATGAKQLLAYGFSSESITKNLTMLGNVASGVSAPLGDIVYLYGTLQTQGRAYTKDIMQFTGRGIPIIEQLAKQFGVTKDQVSGLVEAGKVGFPEVERAFQSMTEQGGMFFDLMQEQSKTLTGQISNLQDSWAKMLNEMGRSQEGLLSSGISGLAALVENYEKVIDIITAMVAIYGVHRAALIVTAALQLTAAQSAAGVTLAFRLQYAQMVILDRMHKILNATMLSNPYVAIATGLATLAAAAYVYTESIDNAAESEKNLDSIRDTATKTTIEQKQKLQDLIKTANDETLSLQEREKALKKINQVSPEFLGGLTLAKLRTEEGRKAIEEYNQSLDLMALKQASFEKRVEIQKQKADLLSGNAEDKIGNLERIKANFRTGRSGSFNNAEYEKIRQQQAKDFDKLLKDIDTYENNEVAKYNAKAKADPAKAGSSVRNEDFIKGEIERLESLKKPLDIHSKKYADYTAQIDKLNKELQASQGKLSAEQNKVSDERLRILNDITNAETEASRKQLSQNNQEIQAAKDKFETLRQEAKKAGLGVGPLARIDTVEKLATGNIKYDQGTKDLKESLDKQKQLYQDYESFKKEVGEKAANARFANDIDLTKTYLDKLQQEFTKVSTDTSDGLLTGIQQERLKMISDEIIAQTKLLTDSKNQEYAEAYNSALSAEEQVMKIRKQYAAKAIALGATITESQKQELKLQMDRSITAANDEAFKKTEVYKKLSEETLLFTKSQLKKEMQAVEELLRNTSIPADLKLRLEKELADLKVNLKMGVDEANIQALKSRESDLITALSDPLVKGTENAKKYRKELQETRKQINEITKSKTAFDFLKDEDVAKAAESLANSTGQLGSAFSQLGSELSYLNEGLGDTVSTMGDLLGVASSAAGSVASFASGDIVGGITKAIGAITGLLSIGRKARESELKAAEEIKQYNLNLQKGEREYQALLRERERQIVRLNKITLDGLKDQAALLGNQSGSIQSEYERLLRQVQAGQQKIGEETYKYGGFLGIGRKTGTRDITEGLSGKTYEELERLFTEGKLTEGTKALFEQLQKLKNEGKDVKQALADLADEANELFTGTTASSITDSIVEGFKNGYRTAEDFASNFQDLMQGAMLNTFKYKVIEAQIEEFYASFADRAKSDEQLSQQEIDELKAEYNAIITNSAAQFSQLQKITSIDQSLSTTSGLKNAMRREMTEATASELTGIYRATYDLMKQMGVTGTQQLNIATQHLMIAIKIEANTRETAINTKSLERLEAIENGITIIANNSKNSQSARDMGMGG
ncbi:MAG TPA: tape measure protein [Daejeonella sp.]|uniref:tape measure protein n=1 Tax=Daejeonella sp. TaxID=2805397 RepID=UPI002EDAE229